jgi:hypothetical protein
MIGLITVDRSTIADEDIEVIMFRIDKSVNVKAAEVTI